MNRPSRRAAVLLAAAGLLLLAPAADVLVPATAGAAVRPAAAAGAAAVAGTVADAGVALVAADAPKPPTRPTPAASGPGITVDVPGEPSRVVQIILLITVLGVAPAILLTCTAFTKIVVVLSLTRSALGTQSVPPNQVLVGLALFLSLFVMGPTLDEMQREGLTPYLDGRKSGEQAYRDASDPLREFMLKHTRPEEIALMTKAAGVPPPKDAASVELRTLVPAFVLSELRAAFIIGFVIFVPFLVVDIVVSAILMSLGMVMLPPSLISLPFKLLLFVLVDGWSLIVTTLLGSNR